MSRDDLRMRGELKSKFETGDRPNSDDFAQMIDSSLNQSDDRIFAVNGKIGIGTQGPRSPLEVTGGTANTRQSFIASDGYNSTFRVAHPDPNMLVMGPEENEELRIGQFKDDSSFFNTKMIVDVNGNVSIGKDLPKSKLHVQGNLRVDNKLGLGDCELAFHKGRLILYSEGVQYNVKLEKSKQSKKPIPEAKSNSNVGIYFMILISWIMSLTALYFVMYYHYEQ